LLTIADGVQLGPLPGLTCYGRPTVRIRLVLDGSGGQPRFRSGPDREEGLSPNERVEVAGDRGLSLAETLARASVESVQAANAALL
jgi:hypothetical protein